MSENAAHLPSPEERINESIHASQGEIHETLLDSIIPGCRVCPEVTVGVRSISVCWSTKPECAVVESITVLSGDVDTERRLTTRATAISNGPRETSTVQRFQRSHETDVDIPVYQLVGPSLTGLQRPNASEPSVRPGVRNRLIVGVSVEGEVRMRVEDNPIRIGEIASPVADTGESVSDGDVKTLADSSDPSECVVSLDVAV